MGGVADGETLKRLSRARQISRLPAFPFPPPSSQPSSHLTDCARQNFYIVRAGYVSYTITLRTSEYTIPFIWRVSLRAAYRSLNLSAFNLEQRHARH